MSTRIFRSKGGQSLVLIALMMIGLIAFLGLILDGGGVYVNRRRSQDASDSAAFAGVRVLALRSDNSTATESSIWTSISNLATANGVITTTDVVASFINTSGANLCTINSNCNGVPSAATGVRVTTTLSLQPYFISVIIGKTPIPIRSVAAAQSGNPNVYTDLMPMTMKVPTQTLTYGVSYQLQGLPTLPGGFQWASFDCASSNADLSEYLTLYKSAGAVMADKNDTYYNPLSPTQYNYPGPPSPNPWVCSGPGGKFDTNQTHPLDCWIDLNGCNWGNTPPQNWGSKPVTSTWTIPVFDYDNGLTGSTAQYHIVMFAEFQLQGYWFANNQCNFAGAGKNPNCKNGLPAPLQNCADTNQKCIMGMFLREATPAQLTPGSCNNNGVDICAIGLSQ